MSTPRYFVTKREHLREHPKNMNTHYPQSQLTETARSLAAYAEQNELGVGNQTPLLVVPVPSAKGAPRFRQETGVWHLVEGTFHVVDGNRRYRSGSILQAQCPPYECRWITGDEASQRIAMTIANSVRYKPSPIDEARHYWALHEEDGLSYQQIAALTGISYAQIGARVKWLELELEIQELVDSGELHETVTVAHALLQIADSRDRVLLAKKFAAEKLSIKAIEQACQKFNARLEENKRANARAQNPQPMVGRGERYAGRTPKSPQQKLAWAQLRAAAHAMCDACDVKAESLRGVPEPAWSLIAHEAQHVCDSCDVQRVKGACDMCPGPQLLKAIILRMEQAPEMKVPVMPVTNGNGNGNGAHEHV